MLSAGSKNRKRCRAPAGAGEIALPIGEVKELFWEAVHFRLFRDREEKGGRWDWLELCVTPTMTEGGAEVTEPQTLVLAWLCQALQGPVWELNRTGQEGAVGGLERGHEAPLIREPCWRW